MTELPLLNHVSFLEKVPVRVSTQAVRDKDFCHFHKHIQLCFVLSGELKHKIDGIDYIQKPGSCAFLLPYMSHTLDALESEDTPIIAYVWFQEDFLTLHGYDFLSFPKKHSHFEGKEIPPIFSFTDNQESATELIREIINEFNKQDMISYDKMALYIAELFRMACHNDNLTKTSISTKRNAEKINKAISYIEKHFPSKITLDELSEISGMSRRTFTSSFKSVTDMTPAQFILSVRISNAVDLIMASETLYDDVARLCGLYNHSNLSRVFVKYLGSPPTKYREERIKNTAVVHQLPMYVRYKWLIDK